MKEDYRGLCLLITVCMILLSSPASASGRPQPMTTGMTLHVGGTGPDNYTSIQDAINHASPGDTVYIYDDSAPYHEIITVNRSITLAGEETTTTIIDGHGLGADLMTITAPHVILHDFTLTHADKNGLTIQADDTEAYHLAITYCTLNGIYAYKSSTIPLENTRLHDSTVTNASYGFSGFVCNHTTITRTIMQGTNGGISFINSFNNNISYNLLDHNSYGVIDSFSGDNLYLRNQITNNTKGFQIIGSTRDTIEQNTFQNNQEHARFLHYPAVELYNKLLAFSRNDTYFFKQFHVYGKTTWRNNFWGEPRTRPYPIFGRSGFLPMPQAPPNRVEFDWHPAQQPFVLPAC